LEREPQKEVSTIQFKIEEYGAINQERALIPVSDLKGSVLISLNYIKETDIVAESEQQLSLDKGVGMTPYGIRVSDTTENLLKLSFITDGDGYANINLSKLINNDTFLKFFKKYGGKITLSLTIEIPKTERYNVFVDNIKINPTWGESGFEPYDYYNNDGSIVIGLIDEKVSDFATLRESYKSIEDSYLLIKKQYESQINGNVDLIIDSVENYEPKSFKTVITRLLELKEGTLLPAIEYTKTAKLTTEYDRLITMTRLVDVLCKMYPEITISDGEGLPYNTDKGLDTEAKTLN
jgi:hypothetical protein